MYIIWTGLVNCHIEYYIFNLYRLFRKRRDIMEQSALIGNEIVSDFYKFILKEVEKLGGTEEDMIEVLNIRNKKVLSCLIAKVITKTCSVKEMSWMCIAKSEDLEEGVKLNALGHITIDKALEEIICANIEFPSETVSFGLSRDNKVLSGPWPEQSKVIKTAISKLPDEFILKIIKREDSFDSTDEGLMRAVISRCLVKGEITTRFYMEVRKIVKRTNSRAILSQLNLDKHIRNLDDIYTFAFNRMNELKLGGVRLRDCGPN